MVDYDDEHISIDVEGYVMQVSLVTRYFNKDRLEAVQRCVYEVANRLKTLGVDCTIYTDGEEDTEYRYGGISVVQIKASNTKELGRAIAGTDGIVNFHGSTPGALLFERGFREHDRLVHTLHDSRARLKELKWLAFSHPHEISRIIRHPNFRSRLLPAFIYREFLRGYITGQDVSWLGRGTSIPMGVDAARFTPHRNTTKYDVKEELDISSSVIMYLGHPYSSRGVDLLISAHRTIYERTGSTLLLVLNPYYECSYLRNLAEKVLPPTSYVMVEDFVKNPEDYFRASDVVALPYKYGGELPPYPLVMLEAMSCGRVVVSTPVNSLGDLLGGGAGVLVRRPHKDVLIHGLYNALMLSEVDKEEMGKLAREKVLPMDWGHVTKRLLEIYERLPGGK
ncbi:MAG: glycosyltransferase family 4 protein [Methermicoccaceae archaeon]